MRNDSDERGAKLLGGSRVWKDYAFQADVQLLGEQETPGSSYGPTMRKGESIPIAVTILVCGETTINY